MKCVDEKEYTIHIENARLHIHTENHYENDRIIPSTVFHHKHIFSEIFMCGEGSIDISLDDGRLIHVCNGDVLVIPPGISHTVSKITENAKWFVINFLCEQTDVYDSEDLYSSFNTLYSKKEIIHLNDTKELYTMADSIIRSSDKKNSIIGAMRFSDLILDLVSRIPGSKENSKSEEIFHRNSTLQNYKKLDKLITANFNKEDAVKIIYDEMFISVRQLDRISKKQYGMTLHGIITENRLNYAEKCLRGSDMVPEKIALSAGFSSRAAFIRAFEVKYGCTPAAYRKMYN